MVIIPRMVASVCGVYNGIAYITVEIKVPPPHLLLLSRVGRPSFFSLSHEFTLASTHTATATVELGVVMQVVCFVLQPDMIGHYLGEFALTYKQCRHGRGAVSANQSRYIPLK